ncbi:MAG TPA: NUDIX domain-containing protein [Deltaproteobacteria bacterium]|nr:NUDIX domain-containing protein [Deltaproteobacteria bacterium]
MKDYNSNSYPAKPIIGVGAIVQKDEKILLVKRGVEPSLGLWAIPGGTLKLGESMRQCAERETREETGITIKAGEGVYTFDFIEYDEQGKIKYHFVVIDFWAKYISGEPRGADDALEAGWFTPEELSKLAVAKNTLAALRYIGFLT